MRNRKTGDGVQAPPEDVIDPETGEVLGQVVDDQPNGEAEPEPEEVDPGGQLSDKIGETTVRLAADTLRGDVRDRLLDVVRNMPKPWQQLTESGQRSLAVTIEGIADDLIDRACQIMAAGGRSTIVGALETYQQKGREVVAKLKFMGTWEVIEELHHACGDTVQLVALNADDFKGQRGKVAISKDQADMLDDDQAVFDHTDQGADLAAEEAAEDKEPEPV